MKNLGNGRTRGQPAVEYIFLVGAALLFVVLLLTLTRTNLFGSSENKVDESANKIQGYTNQIASPVPTDTPVPSSNPTVILPPPVGS